MDYIQNIRKKVGKDKIILKNIDLLFERIK